MLQPIKVIYILSRQVGHYTDLTFISTAQKHLMI